MWFCTRNGTIERENIRRRCSRTWDRSQGSAASPRIPAVAAQRSVVVRKLGVVSPAIDHSPVLSICVPTFNRARYLDCLLQDLAAHIGELGFSYEVLIGDNASEDDTAGVVRQVRGPAGYPLRPAAGECRRVPQSIATV